MKHRLHYALAAIAVAALFLVCRPREPEPAPDDPPSKPLPEIMTLRYDAKWLIAREVAAGRRSLVEAAAIFRDLKKLSDSVGVSALENHHWELRHPVHTDDERLCREVVQWVDGLRFTEPAAYVAAAVARLNDEFLRERQRRGVVRLPDSSTLPPIGELLDQARAARAKSEVPRSRPTPPGW